MIRPLLAIASAILVGLPGATGAIASPCLAPALGDRCERWSYVHDPGYAVGSVHHPAGGLAYAAATTWNEEATTSALLLTALDDSGAPRWSATFTGPDEGYSEATDLAIDRAGERVCVAGWIGTGTGSIPAGYAAGVSCHEPRTGATLWQEIAPAPEGRWRGASAIAIASVPFDDPEGATSERDVVFVTGTDEAAPFFGEASDKNFLTHAFDADDGTLLWTSVYDGPGGRWDGARMIGVSPDGRRLFVGGVVTDEYWNYGVVAYDTRTGERVWSTTHEFPDSGRDGWREDWPMAMALSPDGTTLAVTGSTVGARGDRYGTIALDAADGSTRWSEIHASDAGPDEVPDSLSVPPVGPFATIQVKGSSERGNALAFSPTGDRLYVTGTSRGFPAGPSYTTVAYDVVDGDEAWTARYHGPTPGIDVANAIAVAPSGERIYVTGRSSRAGVRFAWSSGDAWTALDDIATVAYDREGAQLWAARFDGANEIDIGHAITADGERVHVAGRSLSKEDPLLPFPSADLVVLSYEA